MVVKIPRILVEKKSVYRHPDGLFNIFSKNFLALFKMMYFAATNFWDSSYSAA